MTLDLRPVIERLTPENRDALFEQARREGITVGQLVKRWIGERLSSNSTWKEAA